jgi:hypothetical protein
VAGKIFLNYRRSDAEAWADRLYERLTARLPQLDIFMDIVGKIPLGRPWATWLDSQVAECDLMLVLIGRSWVAEFEARDRPAERDYVRVEIESALARQIPVVPVFLGDTPVPPEDSLPPSVRPVLGMQAARLQRGSFEADVNALIEGALQSMSLPSSRAGTPSPTVLHPAPPPAAQPDPPLAERLVEIGIAGAGQVRTLVPGEGDGFTDQGGLPELVLAPRGDCPAPPGSEADAAYAAGMATLGAPLDARDHVDLRRSPAPKVEGAVRPQLPLAGLRADRTPPGHRHQLARCRRLRRLAGSQDRAALSAPEPGRVVVCRWALA